MKLSKEAVKDFIQIYKNEFGETLKFEEAEIKATEFLEFMRLILYK